MTRVIAALEDMGFVERSAHPTDGRQFIVALTAAGRNYVTETISVGEAWLDRKLAALGEEERAVLARAAEIIDRMAGNE